MRHIVAFKYKDGTTEDQIQTITEVFSQFPEKIPGIVDFEYGENNSPEGLHKGFNHVYVLTFDSEKSRDEYLPHPEHKKLKELLDKMGILEDVFVIDYPLNN
ncbi:Dabb family protein [Gilvimarinus sp. DA14]|uniref:Dabb family protein n=1 Tax=Gilvimarinus sp. DA14 TaxID=2956798 RepID=UPI0020B766ED|nr:Dabb family protein [Gilvimarinus sp. DA14]UTF59145.1 Dabb family protein [Gilvimarinus sp. DA14]